MEHGCIVTAPTGEWTKAATGEQVKVIEALAMYMQESTAPASPAPPTVGTIPITHIQVGDKCVHCGIELSEAYETSMGMYCPTSATGLHEAPEAECQPTAAPESPLDRMIRLVATSDLVQEAPQVEQVPLLNKAWVIAGLYQAKALQEIAETLAEIDLRP